MARGSCSHQGHLPGAPATSHGVSAMSRESKGYLWSEIGALMGAVVFAIPVGAAWAAVVLPFIFEYDDFVAFATGLAIALAGLGGAWAAISRYEGAPSMVQGEPLEHWAVYSRPFTSRDGGRRRRPFSRTCCLI